MTKRLSWTLVLIAFAAITMFALQKPALAKERIVKLQVPGCS